MQEEISLREIIDIFWKGKMIIALSTLVCMVLAFVVSFFIMSPVYESTAMVRLNLDATDNGEDIETGINSLVTTARSDVALNRIADKLTLDKTVYSIDVLREMIQVEVAEGTKVVEITTTGNDTDMITKVANLLAFELGARAEITDRSNEIVSNQKSLENIEDQLLILQKELDEIENKLANTPEKLVTTKTVADDAFLQSIVEEQMGQTASEVSSLQLINEQVNPVYTTLKSREAEVGISISKLQEQQQTLLDNIAENQTKITELETQINNEKLKTTNSERLLDGFNAVFISPAIEPEIPISPKKLLNIMVGGVVGLLLSTAFVFLREYMRKTSSVHSESVTPSA